MKLKKIFNYFLILLAIVAIFFAYYLYKLRTLAIEGNRIFGLRCKNVNPLLIRYKKLFLKYSDYVNKFLQQGSLNDQDKYQLVKYFKNYLEKMEEYTKAEKNWLAVQKKFMERWDFKLFFPWYMKKGIQYQYEVYQGYLNDALYILDIKNGKVKFKPPSEKGTEVRQKLNNAIERYNQFILEELSGIRDWRRYVMNVPLDSLCTKENMTIPDTTNSINFEGETIIQPTTIPIDPDKTS